MTGHDERSEPYGAKNGGRGGASFEDTKHAAQSAAAEAARTIRHEMDDAKARFAQAGGRMSEEAGNLGETARTRLLAEADRQKDDVAASLDVLSSSFRRAADDFEGRDEPGLSRLARGAAEGADRLSDTLHSRSVGDMAGSVARYGRENPVAFVATGLLAGFALGRFLRASERGSPRQPPHAAGDAGPRAGSAEPAGHGGQAGQGERARGGGHAWAGPAGQSPYAASDVVRTEPQGQGGGAVSAVEADPNRGSAVPPAATSSGPDASRRAGSIVSPSDVGSRFAPGMTAPAAGTGAVRTTEAARTGTGGSGPGFGGAGRPTDEKEERDGKP